MDYFTRLRMRHACQLLDATTARVKEIAAALGYEDPFYFSRVFKSLSAVAPVHYRGLGFDQRLAIKDLLEPKNQAPPADLPGQLSLAEPGRAQFRSTV
jgi:AraC-like DNA-binding protein